MSVVTNTILYTDVMVDEDPNIDKIQAWLKENCNQQFKRIDDKKSVYGGSKMLECNLFVAAFNYLPIESFIAFLKELDWTEEYYGSRDVQLILMEEQGDRFYIEEISRSKNDQ